MSRGRRRQMVDREHKKNLSDFTPRLWQLARYVLGCQLPLKYRYFEHAGQRIANKILAHRDGLHVWI